MKYTIYRDTARQYRWRLRATNHRIIADSAEAYHHRADCVAAIDLVKSSKDAPVQDE